jgi:ATP phosphoribosyltransferase
VIETPAARPATTTAAKAAPGPGRAPAETLRFGVPGKGRIGEEVFEFLESCGLKVRRSSERQLTARIAGQPRISVILQRSADILTQVADGQLDLGISNIDVLTEHAGEAGDLLLLYDDLGFSVADVMVEVPDSWVDVTTLADLADVAAAMRERGDELRVATSFPNLTRRFFYEHGITHFSLVQVEGGVEAAPTVGFADAAVDLVSTGVTLKENHLKVLRNGCILHTQACLIGNRRALLASRGKREIARQVIELIEARLRAQSYYSVTANLRGASEEDVARALLNTPATRGNRGPTVARVYTAAPEPDGSHWFAATIIVEAGALQVAVDHLREVGGSGMSVVPVRYLFDQRSRHFETMLAELGVQ